MFKKKIEFSKLIVIVEFIVFLYCLYTGLHTDFTSITDTAVFVAAITTSAGVLGTSCGFYYKKAQSEFLPKVQTGLYKDTMNIRLEYNQKMLELKKEFDITDEEIDNIESQSRFDELSDNVLDTAISELDSKAADAHTDIEQITY